MFYNMIYLIILCYSHSNVYSLNWIYALLNYAFVRYLLIHDHNPFICRNVINVTYIIGFTKALIFSYSLKLILYDILKKDEEIF